jgi:hypothetical protein
MVVVGEKNAGRCHAATPNSVHDMHDNSMMYASPCADSEHRQCARDSHCVAMGMIKRYELR